MAPDLVRPTFTAAAPNVLWCGDLTEIDTGEGGSFTWIVDFYDTHRRHGACDGLSPIRTIDGRGQEARSRITEPSTVSGN